jgi:PAS domain S-box-containing protein
MNRANDLFLLLLNLSQLRDQGKVTRLFLESLGALFAEPAFQLSTQTPDGANPSFPIATRHSVYGHIVWAGTGPLSVEDRSLLHNATQMLAVVLERLALEEQLEKERSRVVRLADQRLEELTATVAQLQMSRNASINLVEDLTLENAERRRAEEALRASEARFRTLAEMAPVGIYLADLTGGCEYANPCWCDTAGLSLEQALGNGWIEGLHPEDRASVFAGWQKMVNAAGDWGMEYRFKTRTGRVTWIYGVAAPQRDAAGRIIRYVGINLDITERKRAQESITKITERLNLAITSARAGVWDWNLETNELIWDDRMFELYGLRHENFSRGVAAWEQGLHPDDASRANEECQAALRGEMDFDTEFRVQRPDGTVVHIKANGLAEKALREKDLQFRTVMETLPLIGVILDRGGCITLCNDFFLQLTGWQREEVINRNWFALFLPPEVQEQFFREVFLVSIDAGNIPVTYENEIVTRKGERRLVSWHNTVLRESSGRIIGVASIGDDITARKRVEAEREKLQAQLAQAQKMESVGRLAGGVAHDFNNMLGAILGNTSLALQELHPDSPVREHLQEIENCAHRAADLTRQLLAFARKQTIAPKVIDLNATVEGMLKMLRRLIGEDIALAWLPGANLKPVKVDPSQIDQLLANLCVNARDAITGVGKITIETGNVSFDEAHAAEHAGFVPGDYVLLAVSDNGCGMDKELLGHLFEPFFTTKGVGKGTGLGLATVYGIVKQNLGFINVYSEPSHGTTFKIYLPRHEDQVVQLPKAGPAQPASRGHETILLVEDEPALLRICRRALERLGYTVLAASTPAEAIHLAAEYSSQIHLLITDVVMPEMNGRELAKQLHSLHPNLKRLFMSGYTANVIAHHGVLQEGIQFLQKPFTVVALADKVREAIGSA